MARQLANLLRFAAVCSADVRTIHSVLSNSKRFLKYFAGNGLTRLLIIPPKNGVIHGSLADEVRGVCEPIFILFDFQEIASQLYKDIVRRFEADEST